MNRRERIKTVLPVLPIAILLAILMSLCTSRIASGQILNTSPTWSAAYLESGDSYPDVLTNTDSTKVFLLANSSHITTDGNDTVTQWNDISGNGNHLLGADGMGTAPLFTGDSVYFDGSNDTLSNHSFTLSQPFIMYVVCSFGDILGTEAIVYGGSAMLEERDTPAIRINAGGNVTCSSTPATNTYMVITCVFNGVASSIEINEEGADTGNALTGGMTTLHLASKITSAFNEVSFKAIVIGVFTGTSTKSEVYSYLNGL